LHKLGKIIKLEEQVDSDSIQEAFEKASKLLIKPFVTDTKTIESLTKFNRRAYQNLFGNCNNSKESRFNGKIKEM